jgi:hypothetical protein
VNRVRLTVQAAVAALTLAAVMLFTPTAASASTCAITVGGHAGSYVCDYPPLLVQWPDGHYQYFVVGTNSAHSVYDTWQLSPGGSSWSKWRNLGGTALSRVYLVDGTSTWITIEVIGNDHYWWCKTWSSSSDWGAWYHC